MTAGSLSTRGAWRPPRILGALAFLGYILIYLPLLALIFYSVYAPTQGLGTEHGWTFYWYRSLFTNPVLFRALLQSLLIAFISATGAIGIGLIVALVIDHGLDRRGRRARVAQGLTTLSLVIPEIVLGISLLICFSLVKLTLGLFSVVLAHVALAVPYSAVVVLARLQKFDPDMESAARDLGATPLQAFMKIKLPLIFPGILSGWLIAFTLSFDDFIVAFFTAGVDVQTLPLRLYSMIRFGLTPEANAISTLIFLLTVSLVLGASKAFLRSARS